MDELQEKLEKEALANAKEYGLQCEFSYCDSFPETVCLPESNEKIRKAAKELGYPVIEMPQALRGSEDFGHFTKLAKGAAFFMGMGEGTPDLHTSHLDFDDELIESCTEMFKTLVRNA
jgi:metal-dependent amidase/aminoacylase/carboxypeptidase family protein